jgi:hypothetical protein
VSVLVELCAGTAAVSLRALAGRPVQPLTGFMGGKRRWASTLASMLGHGTEAPDRVVLVDAGPWGDVWTVLLEREHRREVARIFRHDWGEMDPHELWRGLVALPPPEAPAARVAQYLWLQARSAGTIPIWWSPERLRWESPTGSRTETAHERGGTPASGRQAGISAAVDHPDCSAACISSRGDGPAYEAGGLARVRLEAGSRKVGRAHSKGDGAGAAARRGKPPHVGCRGVQRPVTIARRLEALELLDWSRVEVVHDDVGTFEPVPGSRVLFDPPYRGCPRYAALLQRARVLEVALRHASAGAEVIVCEGEPLPLDGWWSARLAGADRTWLGGGGSAGRLRQEWLTASFPISVPEQLSLWTAA